MLSHTSLPVCIKAPVMMHDGVDNSFLGRTVAANEMAMAPYLLAELARNCSDTALHDIGHL